MGPVKTIEIYSIFNSISGEYGFIPQGTLTTFIRFAGCNLACKYCDTKKAIPRNSGRPMTLDAIMREVKRIGCWNVLITGGEPLAQREGLDDLVDALKNDGYVVSIETNGSYIPLTSSRMNVDAWIFDYKLPSSGMECEMHPELFGQLWGNDVVKFVCQDRRDYLRMKAVLFKSDSLDAGVHVAVSAAAPLTPAELVKWLQKDKLFSIVVSTQIHKWVFPSGEAEKASRK